MTKKTTGVKPPRPLTKKQKIFVKHIIDNPKDSATEAAAIAYNVTNRPTAATIAKENIRKPQIISALAAHNQLIENTLIQTVDEYQQSDKQWQRTLAVDTSKWIHDKIHGKAVQRTEATGQHIIAHVSTKKQLYDL